MLSDVGGHPRAGREQGGRPPRALALFETTSEVLGGLLTAHEHHEPGAEEAFRD